MKKIFIFLLLFWHGVAIANDAEFRRGVVAYHSGNYADAYNIWLPLAESGDANAQFNIGLMYDKGEGVVEDDSQAAMWYRRAAVQVTPGGSGYGAELAAHAVRQANEAGQGLAAEQLQAERRSQAEQRHGYSGELRAAEERQQAEAEHGYNAELQAASERAHWESKQGYGGSLLVDEQRWQAESEHGYAAELRNHRHRMATERGGSMVAERATILAQYNLGLLYERGDGVPQDYIESYMWLAISESNRQGVASRALQRVTGELSPVGLREARRLVKLCKNTYYKNCGRK